jgi:Alpha-galactosidase, CBM13 domain
LSGGRHRYRLLGRKGPRGLRPLTVVALCSVIAVVAVLATEATHPYSLGGGTSSSAATNPDSSDDPTVTDDPSDAPSLAVDPTDDASDSPSPTTATTDPAPAPAPAVAPAPADPAPPAPVPVPVPVPVPAPTTASPSPSPAPPPGPLSFEAESSVNTLSGTRTMTCSPCSGGKKVGYVGKSNTLQFNDVRWGNGGYVLVVLSYVNGDSTYRYAKVSVDGGTAVTFGFKSTGTWNSVGTLTLEVKLRSGANYLTITNPTSYGPDFDRITVRAP